MKTLKHRFLFIIISVILFLIPFLWFKPGEMDLGGDSSRLYFYDPLSYLRTNTLFNIAPSATGRENMNYPPLSFISLLAVLKPIIKSSTILISIFHGINLSVGFIFCYLIIKELIDVKEFSGRKRVLEYSAIVAALFYILSPGFIYGWDKVIFTHDQIFLNPLNFFLLLRLFLTNNAIYLCLVLLASFTFSHNFGYFATPPFFAFYPIALLFLILYTKLIRRKKIPSKKLLIGLVSFILIQAFQLIPQIVSLVTPESSIYQVIFSTKGKFDRGLSYFSGISPHIKLSIHLMAIPQMMDLYQLYYKAFIVFPLIVLLGFLWNKGKTFLLTGVFFLITLFLVTANITNTGLTLYQKMFSIPGFSMFRNFYGQWQYVFLFFYTILLGQALVLVLPRVKKKYSVLILLNIGILLIINAWPFINGELINKILWQSKEVKIFTKMDPVYEEALSFIRSLPIDGKVLTLPLTDHGYQILTGKEDGAYQGPSTISYLAGKKDFTGIGELEPFSGLFLEAAQNQDYQSIKKILSLLNIKYIFHNSDPNIYEEKFPEFPYSHVLKFLPKTQKAYEDFIQNLGVPLLASFGDKYHLYQIPDQNYLPHFYIAEKRMYWEQLFTDINIPLSFYTKNNQSVSINQDSSSEIALKQSRSADEILLALDNKSLFLDFFKKRKASEFPSPYVSRKLSWQFYPFVLWREKEELRSFIQNEDLYIDKSIFFAEKRLNELNKWKKEIPLRGNVDSIEIFSRTWQEPNLWEIKRFNEYNSWEVSLLRYEKIMLQLIKNLNIFKNSSYPSLTNKLHLKNTFFQHRTMIENMIEDTKEFTDEEKIYLLRLSRKMYQYLIDNLDLNLPDPSNIKYEWPFLDSAADYEVYVEKKVVEDLLQSGLKLTVNNKEIDIDAFQPEETWIRFENVHLEKEASINVVLNIPQAPNLVEKTKWRQIEEIKEATESAVLAVGNVLMDNPRGLIREVSQWKPRRHYFISFDYKTFGRNFNVNLYEYGGREKRYARKLINESFGSKEWQSYQAIVESGEGVDSALLQILRNENDLLGKLENYSEVDKVEIKNFSIIQVPHPEIVLRRIIQVPHPEIVLRRIASQENQGISTPRITFRKINPTKYKIKVENANQPYSLIFLEAFSRNWRLVNTNKEIKTTRAKMSRFLALLGKYVVNILVKDQPIENKIVKSYFDGKVQEGVSINQFLGAGTFETWGKAEIAEDTHWLTHGYANSWYITPDDMDGKTDYEMVLEMSTQKLFYVSLTLSFSTFLLIIAYLFLKITKNEI